jgi:hypothetical protein
MASFLGLRRTLFFYEQLWRIPAFIPALFLDDNLRNSTAQNNKAQYLLGFIVLFRRG